MKKTNAFIAAALITSMLTSCGGTDTAEITSSESTTTATVSETDTLSAESEETTTEATTVSEVEVTADTEEFDETFIEDAESDASAETITFAEPPTPPETAEEFAYHGRSNVVTKDGHYEDFENALWMTITSCPLSNDDCDLMFLESKEDAAVERIAYLGMDGRFDFTVLGIFRKYDDDFADDPMVGESYWAYKNHLLAVGGDDVLPYFPAGASVPTNIVLFPDCGEFYYYGAATEEEYENYEWHWTISTDLGLTWKPDSESSTVGNFYYGSDPVYYENGVWKCGNTAIWIG